MHPTLPNLHDHHSRSGRRKDVIASDGYFAVHVWEVVALVTCVIVLVLENCLVVTDAESVMPSRQPDLPARLYHD
jgi:hypothetical protein